MINIETTMFIIFAYPDHRWPKELIRWMEQLTEGVKVKDKNRISLSIPNIVCARNSAIEGALRTTDFTDFIFIDQDVRPSHERTTPFLGLDADVKCCQMEHQTKTAWSRPDAFHESLWSTTKAVLEAIEPPWFQHRYNDKHTRMTGCICQSFRDKALEAGFSIAHGGWAEHDQDKSWC